MSSPDPAITAAAAAACPGCGTAARPGARFCRSCGQPLPEPATPTSETTEPPAVPSSPAADTAPDSPAQRRVLRRRLIIAGVVVLVLLAAYTAVAAMQNTVAGPDGPVKDLFAALADRDGGRLGELAGCGAAPLCQPAALRTGYRPPEQVSILGVTYGDPLRGDQTRRPNKNRATVQVRYQLAGAAHEDTVGLQRDSGGLVRAWRITKPPGGLLDILSTTVPTARLAGAQVITVTAPADGLRTDGAVWAPPGIYTLAAVDTPLVGAVPITVTVAGDMGRQRLTLDVAVKPDAAAEVDRQVHARIDACAQQSDLRPDVGHAALSNCPFEYPTQYTAVRDVHWTIVDYPRIELRKSDDGTVTVHTQKPGHATVTFSYSLDVLEPRRWTPVDGTTDITVSGAVTSDGEKITWVG
jgi:hypothetical protein